jgi:ketosteroid isomerase-like protein
MNERNTIAAGEVTTSPASIFENEITELIEVYRQGFLQLNPELLWSIWDQEYEPLIYVAMEKPEPIHGWPAIGQYYAALPKHLEEMVGKKIDSIRIDLLGNTAMAFFRFHSTVKLKGREGLYHPSGRVTMLFRRIQAGWRVIHYHESALAAQAAEAMAANPK